jgi:hypothetical protein
MEILLYMTRLDKKNWCYSNEMIIIQIAHYIC